MSLISGTNTPYITKYIVGNGTGSYPNAATEYSLTIPNGISIMIVKMWGGGGGNSPGSLPANGGNGGYVRFSRQVTVGEVYNFSAGGQGNGGNTGNQGAGGANSGGPLRGGAGSGNGTGTNSGGGGGGSIFTRLSGGTYTLLSIAGGGGGGGFNYETIVSPVPPIGGAGGVTAGTNADAFGITTGGGAANQSTGAGGTAGSGGTGGTNVAGSAGTAIVGTSTTGSLSAFNGFGGTGGGAGGGGGYGGGGGGGWSGNTANTQAGQSSGGGGGGSYLSTTLLFNTSAIAGNSGSFPNSTTLDTDYISGKGIGSTASISSGQNGGSGLIVITLMAPSIPINPSPLFYAPLSTNTDIGIVGIRASIINNTTGSSVTLNSASSLSVLGAPVAGTNTVITNPYALNVNGTSMFNGQINGTQSYYIVYGNGIGISINSGVDYDYTGARFGTSSFQGSAITYNNGIFTIQENGVYFVTANVTWTASGSTERRLMTISCSDGQSYASQVASTNAGGGSVLFLSGSTFFVLNASTTITLTVVQTTGGSLSTSCNAGQKFAVYKLI
jgi:hypothetical protein